MIRVEATVVGCLVAPILGGLVALAILRSVVVPEVTKAAVRSVVRIHDRTIFVEFW